MKKNRLMSAASGMAVLMAKEHGRIAVRYKLALPKNAELLNSHDDASDLARGNVWLIYKHAGRYHWMAVRRSTGIPAAEGGVSYLSRKSALNAARIFGCQIGVGIPPQTSITLLEKWINRPMPQRVAA